MRSSHWYKRLYLQCNGVLLCCAVTLVTMVMAMTMSSRAVAQPPRYSACFESWLGYYEIDADGDARGLTVELLNHAAAELGFTIEYLELPFNRCLQQVGAGEIDMVLTVTGDKALHKSRFEVAYWGISFIVKNSWPQDRFVSLDDFAAQTFILTDGYSYPEPLAAWLATHPHVLTVNRDTGADDDLRHFELLLADRADVLIADVISATRSIAAEDYALKPLSPAIAVLDEYIGYRAGLETLAAAIDDVLFALPPEQLDAMFERHVGMQRAELLQLLRGEE